MEGTGVIKKTKDGRTIRTGKDYTALRIMLYAYQEGACFQCKRNTALSAHELADWLFHVHHVKGRGMGGGKRDDSPDSCVGLCGSCHRSTHHQGASQ
jgi:hypothetical protein